MQSSLEIHLLPPRTR